MHQPRPYGLHGQLTSDEDAAAVDALVRRLSNFKKAGELDSLKMVRALPGGGIAVALDMGGVLKVFVQQPEVPRPPDETFDGFAKPGIPMLFSAVVTKPIVFPGEGVEMRLTRTARRRVSNYAEDMPEGVAERQVLERFAIEYSNRHQEFRPNSSARIHTQYTKLRPSWYSGLMSAVVGIAGGYGKQELDKLPESKIERAKMLLPEKWRLKIEPELVGVRLPGYTGLPDKSGEIQYDYKFNESHGVMRDDKGKCWLIRISAAGVYAMPLPVIPATTTAAFREYIESVNDDEILWMLDQFGGMPSGEGFPPQSEGAFEAWRRAGAVIKVCDSGDFFQNMGYATTCGWAFNLSGTEGYNTCYEFGDDGLQVGKTYQLSIQLTAAEHEGRLRVPDSFRPDDPREAATLNSYLGSLFEALSGNSARNLAIKYKLRRVPVATILSRAGALRTSPQAEVDYWDNLEVEPIAAHSGHVTRVAQGTVWAPGNPKTFPQIKFPEPSAMGDGCISHDFGRLEGYPAPPMTTRCDTTMFVYYVGDDLKYVKYFRDGRTYDRNVEHNYDECMIVGAWEMTETVGSTGLLGNFYITDVDDRAAAAPTTTVTKTVGKDLGYDSAPYYGLDGWPAWCGSLWRNRYYSHTVNSVMSEGYSLNIAICIPFFERSAAIHAMKEATTGKTIRDSLAVYAVRDPNSYRYLTYDRVFAWFGCDSSGNMATATKFDPAPSEGRPFWLSGYSYYPGPCSDFADEGDWMGGLPQDVTHIAHKDPNNWEYGAAGGGPPTVKEYSRVTYGEHEESGHLTISLMDKLQTIHRKVPNPRYFLPSPDEFGNIFYMDAITNCSGSSVYGSVLEPDPEAPTYRKHWGYTRLADHKSAHHFMGVINE
ncbi:hypothetical protein ACCQ08_03255 [Comamonas sp. SY3]|uniref:hypothetical protein n=1 Tax=Comamonas sp. SY3 TaxID=3243601 RepID=UPI0035930831